MLGPATVDNAPLEKQFEVHFQGQILHLFKVLVFAIEVNFGDFFDVLGAFGGKSKAPVSSEA